MEILDKKDFIKFLLTILLNDLEDFLPIESNAFSNSSLFINDLISNEDREHNFNCEISNEFQVTQYFRHKLLRILNELKFIELKKENFNYLTLREREIMKMVALGNNNPQIAEKLFISRSTVEGHRKQINKKLEIHSLPFLLKYAYAFNII